MFALGAVQTAGSFAVQSGAAVAHVVAAKANRDRKKKKGLRGKMRQIKRKTQRSRSRSRSSKGSKQKQKRRNPSRQKKSKYQRKGRVQKQRIPVEISNRRSTKTRLRERQAAYDQEKQRIRSNPNISDEEKARRLSMARSKYVKSQRKELSNYRRRKAALKYAGRSYYAPRPYLYGNALAGFAAGSLAGAFFARTSITTTTASPGYGYNPQQYPGGSPYGSPLAYPQGSSRNFQPQNFPQQRQNSVVNDGNQEEDASQDEPEDEKPFPFNDQEMRSLAHHNTVAGRSVKSLENLRGVHLVTFLNARDDYMNEKDPDLQVTKGLQLMSVAKQLDKRYSTHAMAWGRVMKYRPSEWTREMAQSYADGAGADDMGKIADMSGSEVTKFLSELTPDKLQEIQQSDQVLTAQSIGCSMDDHLSEESATSQIYDRFVVYFSNERKQIEFHMNGFIKINSFISDIEAQRYGIPQVVKIFGRNAIVKKDVKTKCDHLELFANVRMLKRMLTVFPLAIRKQVAFPSLIKDKKSFLTPENEIPKMWFGADIGNSQFVRLTPIILTPSQRELTNISDGDLKITNHIITTITKIVAPYVNLFAKEFPTMQGSSLSVQPKRPSGNTSDSSQPKRIRT